MGERFGLTHLITWLTGGDEDAETRRRGAGAEGAFSTVTMSSLREGYPPMQAAGLFVAIRGERRDGHDFVGDAFANGARAALVARIPANLEERVAAGTVGVLDFRRAVASRPPAGGRWPDSAILRFAQDGRQDASAREATVPLLLLVDEPLRALQGCAAWWRRHQAARVLAITGSVGKTTTKDLLANILEQRHGVLRTQGNLNNELGLPFMLLQLTPAHQKAVLEIGISNVGEMETFAGIAAADVAVVTRVAPAHLHRLKDVSTVEWEKGRLVEALPEEGVAILNGDDERVVRMAARTPARVLRFGQSDGLDVQATNIVARGPGGLDGLEFSLGYRGETRLARVPLVGRHFVTAALAAAAAAFAEGCDWPEVLAGLSHEPETRRLWPRVLAGGATLLDDTYNASPAATQAALDVLAGVPGRRVAVLGDMLELGDYATAGHRDVGAYAAGRTDLLMVVGEFAGEVAAAALASGLPAEQVHLCTSNDEAIAVLLGQLRPGDYVLVKGSRGMRMDGIVRALAGDGTVTVSHP